MITLLLGFGLFVAWMNLTPGYFQATGACGCIYKYLVDEENHYNNTFHQCTDIFCEPSFGDRVKLLLANLDFNR